MIPGIRLPVVAYDAQSTMNPIIAARPFAFKKMFLLDIIGYQGWCCQWKRRSQEQQWLDSLFSVHHTQQQATLFQVSSNDKANKENWRHSRFLNCWENQWHRSHRWMWSTYRVLLTIRSNHTRFRLMTNVPYYDIPASPILLLGFAGIAVALFTLYTVNKAYFNSPLNRWKYLSKLYS